MLCFHTGILLVVAVGVAMGVFVGGVLLVCAARHVRRYDVTPLMSLLLAIDDALPLEAACMVNCLFSIWYINLTLHKKLSTRSLSCTDRAGRNFEKTWGRHRAFVSLFLKKIVDDLLQFSTTATRM